MTAGVSCRPDCATAKARANRAPRHGRLAGAASSGAIWVAVRGAQHGVWPGDPRQASPGLARLVAAPCCEQHPRLLLAGPT